MAGGTPFSQVGFNAREEFVSSDVMKMQNLIDRDLQNARGGDVGALDSTTINPANAVDLTAGSGTPLSGLDYVPTFTVASGFTATIGAGSGYVYYTPGVTADYSPYQVVRWGQQVVSFSGPSGNPRIDVVCAVAGTQVTATASRNILVDPVARTVSAQTVNKVIEPAAGGSNTLQIVTGTAAVSPVVPSIPAGSIPLFYVWVPSTAVSSANFSVCRASYRRAPYPFSAMSGVVSGMGFKWDLTADPASTTAAMIAKGFHHVVIDGEVIEFYGNLDSAAGGVIQDSGNNPFGSAAAATWNKPYYIYAVGGRHNPLPSFNTADHILSPVTIVESTVAPNLATGRPSATLTVPTGSVQAGAVYVGLGFVYRNTTNRAPCIMANGMTYFGAGGSGNNVLSLSKVGTGAESVGTPLNKPALSSRMFVVADVTGSAAGSLAFFPDDGGGAAPPSFSHASHGFVAIDVVNAAQTLTTGEIPCRPGDGGQVWVNGGHASDAVAVVFTGYEHGVRMFNGQVNP